jgi:hypothetical protein
MNINNLLNIYNKIIKYIHFKKNYPNHIILKLINNFSLSSKLTPFKKKKLISLKLTILNIIIKIYQTIQNKILSTQTL